MLADNQHLSVDNHLNVIDHACEETVILNIQVGKGKTTACYTLIEKYARDGYKVIVLSPFKKLVEKDFISIARIGLPTFHYEQLAGDGHLLYEEYLECAVQVMTINCLLGNPGTDRYAQAAVKRDYLFHLRQHCRNTRQKVVMFFDEVHESINNFHAQYIPNLMEWEPLVHKCFVASATFTSASVPVIKYISLITAQRLSIIETPRVLTQNPAKLHLHIVNEEYRAKHLLPLSQLVEVIESNRGKHIHILTGYKRLTTTLTTSVQSGDKGSDIINSVRALSPVIITGDQDNPFNEANNNIGTAFKTGIDIKDPNSVFIIIIPPIRENSEYGIFSDGLPSVIQSFARIRSVGDIHVFMHKPSTIIYTAQENVQRLLFFAPTTREIEYKPQNSFYSLLTESYQRDKARKQAMIDKLAQMQNVGHIRLDYGYPSFADVLIEESENLLVKNEYSFGKELSPYILWAALNSQFTNAKLHQITFTQRRLLYKQMDKDKVIEILKDIIDEEVLSQATKMSLIEGVNFIANYLEGFEDSTLRFVHSGRTIQPDRLWFSPFYPQGIVNLWLESLIGQSISLTKEDYVLASALATSNPHTPRTDKTYAYNVLNRLRVRFLREIAALAIVTDKDEVIIHKDAYLQLSDILVGRAVVASKWLNSHDELLRVKAYQFLPNLQGQSVNAIKSSIFKEFRDCFTNIKNHRRSYRGQKEQFLLIEGQLGRALPPELRLVRFL